jgi:hypothetical protein
MSSLTPEQLVYQRNMGSSFGRTWSTLQAKFKVGSDQREKSDRWALGGKNDESAMPGDIPLEAI